MLPSMAHIRTLTNTDTMRILLTLLLSCPIYLLHAQDAQRLKTQPVEAAVYQGGAVITHQADFDLRAGSNTIHLLHFPEHMDLNSIQISTTPDYEITGIRHEVNRAADGLSPLGRSKRDSLDKAVYQLKSKAIQRGALEEELRMLEANHEIGGQEKPLSVEELEKMANFIRRRVADTRQRALDISEEEAELDKRIKRLQRELADMRTRGLQAQREVVIDLQGHKAARSRISVSYLTNRAGWTPHHDLRSEGTDKPLEIVTRARVQQNTGIDWKDVQLTLITGTPSLGGTSPTLQPWYLYLHDPASARAKMRDARLDQAPARSQALYEVEVVEDAEAPMPNFVETRQTMQSTYALNLPYQITGDNHVYNVELRRLEVPANYRHRAVPKLGQDVFLTAELTDWDAYNLLPGDAMVYFEGNLVARSYLDPYTPDDTMRVSMGRDRNVRVSYELAKDYSQTRSLGSKRRVSRGYDIAVLNNGPRAISLRIEDQAPLSSGSDIEVKSELTDGGRLNVHSGLMSWDLDLEPGERRELGLRYEVTYPKKMRISGL